MRSRWKMSVTVVLTLMLASMIAPKAHSAAEKEEPSIEGVWRVVSVELAEQNVAGLEGAKLTLLPGGKKTFELPSGVVEKGTYSVDASATPKRIDTTTEGREGTEKGIYALEGQTLKLCIATRGGERPAAFETKAGTDLILIALKRADPAEEKPAPKPMPPRTANDDKPNGTRPFHMGFTGFVHDLTPDAVADSRKFVRENGDILCHHIEGVPWGEVLRGEAFPKAMAQEWEGKKSATPPKGKVYLAISPGRGELKLAEKAGPLPKELKGKEYDDPLVMETYLKYCRRAIEFFRPDYLCIGIEVNEIHRDPGPQKWAAYVALHKHVYENLKKDHPQLPIFASWTLHQMFQARGGMLEEFEKLMPHNDLVGVSYYPFFVPEKDRLGALDWMVERFARFKKPFAMVETNDAAERLPLPGLRVVIEGTPDKQLAYYRKLLATAQAHDFEFVISFIHRDYDALWERIKAFSPELFMAWRDCGLVDEKGEARPAYEVWKAYLKLPRRASADGGGR